MTTKLGRIDISRIAVGTRPAREGGKVLTFPVREGQLVLDRPYALSPESPWARWDVRDEAGKLVGLVAEELGCGRPTYAAAHNPNMAAWGALWRSEGHDTPREALAALGDHLGEPAGEG